MSKNKHETGDADVVRSRGIPEEIAKEAHYREIRPALEKGDPSVLHEVNECGILLQYLPEKLRADHFIVLGAVKNDPHALEFADKKLRDDFEIVMAAVEQWGTMLSLASSRLQDNEDIALMAVKSHSYALRDVSSRLQDDESIVFEAVKRNVNVMEYASKRLRHDKNFLNKVSLLKSKTDDD